MDSLLHKIMKSGQVRQAIDMNAGRFSTCIYCASWGAEVEAISHHEFPAHLEGHPHIQLLTGSVEGFEFIKKYDLIIARRLLQFLKPEIVFKNIIPQIISALAEGGYLYLMNMAPDDVLYFKNPSPQITSERLKQELSSLNFCFLTDDYIIENHQPQGEHKHHVEKIVFQKNNSNFPRLSFE